MAQIKKGYKIALFASLGDSKGALAAQGSMTTQCIYWHLSGKWESSLYSVQNPKGMLKSSSMRSTMKETFAIVSLRI